MASSKEYLEYVLDLLREVDNVSYKKMMGEYLLYQDGILFGGVFDNRFLIKETSTNSNESLNKEIPYPGAKAMLVVDSEDCEYISTLIQQTVDRLKRKKAIMNYRQINKETIEIIGNNYTGKYERERIACRAIIINDNQILLSYEKNIDQYMLPGGGKNENENDIDCVVRELQEETGYIVKVQKCALIINEYYGSAKFVDKYYICKITGKSAQNLTEEEKDCGLEPKWISIEKAIDIFSSFNEYRINDEMRCGMYYREHSALKNILANLK